MQRARQHFHVEEKVTQQNRKCFRKGEAEGTLVFQDIFFCFAKCFLYCDERNYSLSWICFFQCHTRNVALACMNCQRHTGVF